MAEVGMNKKADISLATLATVILLVLGFGILLWVILQFGFNAQIDRETCHQSVIVRATTPAFAGLQSYVPLSCRTEKICITSKLFGGECSEFAGEKGITKVRVTSKLQLEKFLAQNLFDCWTMMGEGKVSIFSQWVADTYGFGGVYPSCVVCSRIAFDDKSLMDAGINAAEVDVEGYMQTHLIPDKNLTYSDYLSGDGGKIVPIAPGEMAQPVPEEQKTDSQKALDGLGEAGKAELAPEVADTVPTPLNFKTDTVGVIFTQISAPTHGGAFANLANSVLGILGGSAVLGPGAFFSGTKAMFSKTIIKSAPAGGVTLASGKFVQGGRFLPKSAWTTKIGLSSAGKVVIALAVITEIVQQATVAWDRSTSAGYCGDISVGSEARDGCSVVRQVKYNATDLETYCSVIESIP